MEIKKIYRSMWELQLQGRLSKKERKTFKGLMYIFVKFKRGQRKIYDALYNSKKTLQSFEEWFENKYIFETGKGFKSQN